MSDTLLCVVAHPDDESRLCGGILAHLARVGVAAHVLSLTRGEGGELGDPPLATRDNIGAVREQEMVCAVQALGARSLTFLDYVDPVVGPDDTLSAPEHDPVFLAGQIAGIIKQFEAAVVLTHGSDGEYGHPAHKVLHQLTLAAVMSLGDDAPLLYSFAAHFADHPYPRLANDSNPAHFVLDVSPYLDNAMLAAANCHATQHALFVRRMSAKAGRPVSVAEVVARVPREGVHRHHPPLTNLNDSDRFIGWLKREVAT